MDGEGDLEDETVMVATVRGVDVNEEVAIPL
jgi:hypothetical protein